MNQKWFLSKKKKKKETEMEAGVYCNIVKILFISKSPTETILVSKIVNVTLIYIYIYIN